VNIYTGLVNNHLIPYDTYRVNMRVNIYTGPINNHTIPHHSYRLHIILSFVNRVEDSYDQRCFIKHIYALVVRCSDVLSIAFNVLNILLFEWR
jgi:hypothetical protein